MRAEIGTTNRLTRAALWVMSGMLLLATAPAAYAHRIEKTFSVTTRPVVSVRNNNGKITVKSWQKNEVLVVAIHASEKVEVDAEQRGNRIDISTHGRQGYPVFASRSGYVSRISISPYGYGKMLQLRHSDLSHTHYLSRQPQVTRDYHNHFPLRYILRPTAELPMNYI